LDEGQLDQIDYEPPKMPKPLKPIKVTIDDLKGIVGDNHQLVQAGDEETILAEEELADILANAKIDYEHLCPALGLQPVPLDVFCPSGKSEATTLMGTPIKNFTPGFSSKTVVLPIIPGTFSHVKGQGFSFPPSTWDLMHPEWPRWRLDLWHETLHQVENDIFKTWDGSKKEHGRSYMQAIEYAASRLSPLKHITTEQLRMLALGG
jgi:hypothetical protein